MNNLKTYRQRAGLTIDELAAKMGVSNATISKVERGICDMGGQLWKAAAEALDCSVEDLLGV